MRIRTILVPTDFLEHADYALTWAFSRHVSCPVLVARKV